GGMFCGSAPCSLVEPFGVNLYAQSGQVARRDEAVTRLWDAAHERIERAQLAVHAVGDHHVFGPGDGRLRREPVDAQGCRPPACGITGTPCALASAAMRRASLMPPHHARSGWMMWQHLRDSSSAKPQRVYSCSPVATAIPCTRRRSSA